MASEPPKTPPPAEQQQPAYPMAYPATYPPAFATPITAFPPSFYTAPSPESGAIAIDANGILPGLPPGTQIMMLPPLPPGMVYAIPPPPPGQAPFVPPAITAPPPGAPIQLTAQQQARLKRKQVKNACTNCANACKRCDEARPCERCVKYGLGDSCVDGQRKERKKGIKRGPYKRRNKDQQDQQQPFTEFAPQAEAGAAGGEWQGQQQGQGGSASPPPPPPGQEGYYPVCFPLPGLMPGPPPMPEGGGGEQQAGGGGDQQGGAPVMPYYYPPPFPYYGMVPPPHIMQQQPPPPMVQQSSPQPPTDSDGSDSTSPATPQKRPSQDEGEDAGLEKRQRTESS